jgi:aminoglycoside phosphotransferase (APT) family kinase protein
MGVPAGGYPWKALIALAGTVDTDPVQAATARRVVDEVLAEHEQST